MGRMMFDADHDAFRASVREYVDRNLTPRVDEFIHAKELPRDVWIEAGKQGLLGLEIPEEHGGSAAGDYRYNTVLTEELARVNMAVPSCFGIHTDIVTPYLVKLTTEEQRERWLPQVATGERLLSIAMTEPSGGSDLAALRTTATQDGDGWVINGAKTFITNGSNCDLVVVATRTTPAKGAKGITLFAVEAGSAGFSKGRKLDKIGQPESDTAELFFDNVRVTEAEMIGELDRGFLHMMDLLPQERLNTAVTNLAHAAQILRETIDYAQERHAFGTPIGSLQANKFTLAEAVTEVEVAQAYLDQCVLHLNAGTLTPVDAAKAKLWSSETQNRVLDRCVQIWGGYGFMSEYRAARAWRDARVTRVWAGTNEIMKELIGRDLGL